MQGGLGAEEPLSLPGASEAEPGLELRLGKCWDSAAPEHSTAC